MLTYIIGSLIVGFALGWGIYWYLGQEDRRQWKTVWETFERRPLVTGAVVARVWERARLWEEQTWSAALPTKLSQLAKRESARETGKPDQPGTPAPAMAMKKGEKASSAVSQGGDEIGAYCPVCHQRRPIQNARRVVTRTGHTAVRGTCGECGGELFAFLK